LYFTADGEYDQEWPLFITKYLDQFIYMKRFHGGRITIMPDISDTMIAQIKQWQRERLVLCSSNIRTSFPYVLPDILMELYCIYMDSMFIVQQSTIEGAGRGLFLRSGRTLSEDMYFPYSGVLMPHIEKGGEDDKDILIRDNLLICGSSEYEFVTTGNTYVNLMSMCNERLSKDITWANNGEITDSGLIRMRRVMAREQAEEITIIYATIDNDVLYREG